MADATERHEPQEDGGWDTRRILKVLLSIVLPLIGTWLILAYSGHWSRTTYSVVSLNPAQGVTVQLLYPRALLIDQPHHLQIDFSTDSPLISPLTITIKLPDGIRSTEQQEDVSGLNSVIQLGVGEIVSQTVLAISNSGAITGSGFTSESLQIATVIDGGMDETSRPIAVESSRDGAIRLTLMSFTEQSAPLLLAVVALWALGNGLIDLYNRERDENRKKRIENEEIRTTLKNTLEAFHRSLREADVVSARIHKQEMDRLKVEIPDTGELRDSSVEQGLLEYAEGGFFANEMLQGRLRKDLQNSNLTSNLAGALVAAATGYQGELASMPKEAKEIYLELPLERLKDPAQRHVYLDTLHSLFAKRLQFWKLETPCPGGQTSGVEPSDWSPAERAEEECGFLTTNGKNSSRFWAEHEAYQPILESFNGCALLVGSQGVGRTAFARYALEYFTKERWFAVLLSGRLSPAKARRQMAEALMHYVGHKATRLLTLEGEAQRRLLAEVLVAGLGCSEAESRVRTIYNKGTWLKSANDSDQRRLWEKVGHWELDLLGEAMQQVSPEQKHSDTPWFAAFNQTTRDLGFHGARLVLDGTSDLSGELTAALYCWDEAGLPVTMCKPTNSNDPIENNLKGLITIERQLAWTPVQLRQLAAHRLNCTKPTRSDALRSLFNSKDKALEEFLTLDPSTPRQLGQLWRRMIQGTNVSAPFTAENVAAAKTALAQHAQEAL